MQQLISDCDESEALKAIGGAATAFGQARPGAAVLRELLFPSEVLSAAGPGRVEEGSAADNECWRCVDQNGELKLMPKKHRLILVIGADTQEGLLAGLHEMALEDCLMPGGCIGSLACGADFDYTVDTTQGSISMRHLVDTIRDRTWEKGA